ncbi:MAG: response regulator [Acetatifactor sp.]|nr:response regulator [Acetatifactor sp.]
MTAGRTEARCGRCMEGMDGLETARQIKAECPKVHIVPVTAYVNYAQDGYKVKASRFLLKDDLKQTLQECMDDTLVVKMA